jgi:hypothetical protein
VLSIQKCRFLLGADCKLTDSQIEQLRREIYAFADIAVETFCAQKTADSGRGAKLESNSGCISAVPGPERDKVEERAAILEYDGNLRRPEAERQAFGEWAQSKKPTDRKPKKLISRKTRKKATKRNSSKPDRLDILKRV